MKFDSITPVDADGVDVDAMIIPGGEVFPENPVVGQLFTHSTHGLSCYYPDENWYKVARPFLSVATHQTTARTIASSSATYGIKSDGTIEAWGTLNSSGQLNVPTGESFIQVAAQGVRPFALALTESGVIRHWGSSVHGVNQVPTESGHQFVVISSEGAYALTDNGTIVHWGVNTSGNPNVPSGDGFVHINSAYASGRNIAVHGDGSIHIWGNSNHADLVNNIPTTNDFIAACTNGECAMALRANGTYEIWGHDTAYDLVSTAPEVSNVRAIALSDSLAAVILDDDSLVVWSNDDTFGRVSTAPSSGVIAVHLSNGTESAVALHRNGTVSTWGKDSHGQVTLSPSDSDFKLG